MNVLIIEDEPAAAENLKYILKEIEPSITFEIVIDTVVDAIDFFNKPHNIELAFFDIHLADGISLGAGDNWHTLEHAAAAARWWCSRR